MDKGYIGHKAAKAMKRAKNIESRQEEAISQKSQDVFSRIQIEKVILEYCPTLLFLEHEDAFCNNICTVNINLG